MRKKSGVGLIHSKSFILSTLVVCTLFLDGCVSAYLRASETTLNEGLPSKAALIITGNTFMANYDLTYLSIQESIKARGFFGGLIENAMSAKGYDVAFIGPAGIGYCYRNCLKMPVFEEHPESDRTSDMLPMKEDVNTVAYHPPEFKKSPEYVEAVDDFYLQMLNSVKNVYEKDFAINCLPRLDSLQIIQENTGADMVCFAYFEEIKLSFGLKLTGAILKGLYTGATGIYSRPDDDSLLLMVSCIDTRDGKVLWQRLQKRRPDMKDDRFVKYFHYYLPDAGAPLNPECTVTGKDSVIKCPFKNPYEDDSPFKEDGMKQSDYVNY